MNSLSACTLVRVLNISLFDYQFPPAVIECLNRSKSGIGRSLGITMSFGMVVINMENIRKQIHDIVTNLSSESKASENHELNAVDRLSFFLDKPLEKLLDELSSQNCNYVLDVIWNELASILIALMNESMTHQRPLIFFTKLRIVLKTMIDTFTYPEEDRPMPSSIKLDLDDADKMFELYGSTSVDLIHRYYKDHYAIQQVTTIAPDGVLTVRCYFTKECLVVEIVKAKYFLVRDIDSSGDPFVSLCFYPEIENRDFQTKIHKKTQYPNYNEKFAM